MPLDIGVKLDGQLTASNDLGVPAFTLTPRSVTNLQQGTAASMADILYADTKTIAASGSYSLDLNGTADQNVFGVNLALAKVKFIYIKASAANTNSVVVGNGTNPFVGPFSAGTITITIPPGGEFFVSAPVGGWSLTGGASDILKLANSSSGTGVDCDIIIGGTSA